MSCFFSLGLKDNETLIEAWFGSGCVLLYPVINIKRFLSSKGIFFLCRTKFFISMIFRLTVKVPGDLGTLAYLAKRTFLFGRKTMKIFHASLRTFAPKSSHPQIFLKL